MSTFIFAERLNVDIRKVRRLAKKAIEENDSKFMFEGHSFHVQRVNGRAYEFRYLGAKTLEAIDFTRLKICIMHWKDKEYDKKAFLKDVHSDISFWIIAKVFHLYSFKNPIKLWLEMDLAKEAIRYLKKHDKDVALVLKHKRFD